MENVVTNYRMEAPSEEEREELTEIVNHMIGYIDLFQYSPDPSESVEGVPVVVRKITEEDLSNLEAENVRGVEIKAAKGLLLRLQAIPTIDVSLSHLSYGRLEIHIRGFHYVIRTGEEEYRLTPIREP